MERIFFLLILLGVAFAIYRFLRTFRVRHLVHEYQTGLLYQQGKLIKQVGAGVYWLNPRSSSLTILDTRRSNLIVAGQEVATADNVGLKVSVVLSYSIADAEKAVHSVANYTNELYIMTQLVIREELAKSNAETLFENATELSSAIQESLTEKVNELGLELHSVKIRDLMFANDLKRAFNDVLKARKEAEARLERARGESAALRNLANAAQLLDKNPNLRSLRLMQAIENSKGSSFSIDTKMLDSDESKDA